MSRPVQTIKLSNCEVDVVTYLTWGEHEDLTQSYIQGTKLTPAQIEALKNQQDIDFDFDLANLVNAKYVLLELAIKEIREGDKKVPYTKDWVRNLSVDDGNKLYAAVEPLAKKK